VQGILVKKSIKEVPNLVHSKKLYRWNLRIFRKISFNQIYSGPQLWYQTDL